MPKQPAPKVKIKAFLNSPKKTTATAKRRAAFKMQTSGRKIIRPGGAGSGLIRNKLKGQS